MFKLVFVLLLLVPSFRADIEAQIQDLMAKVEQLTEENQRLLRDNEKILKDNEIISNSQQTMSSKVASLDSRQRTTSFRLSSLESNHQATSTRLSSLETNQQLISSRVFSLEINQQTIFSNVTSLETSQLTISSKVSSLESAQQNTSSSLSTTFYENIQTNIDQLKASVDNLQMSSAASAAYFSVAANSTEGYSQGNTIKFPHTFTNVVPAGSTGGWDAITNTYTCPITGDYMFVVTLWKWDGADSYNNFIASLTRTSLSGAGIRMNTSG